jgi:catechol 2,3-dioxygenase-like lactoylglutathione lyase family enzyme
MTQFISAVTVLVPDYDQGLAFYVDTLGFVLVADTALPDGKRWVLVSPEGEQGTNLLLAKADTPEQITATGNQTGGRVMMFLTTDDFAADHERYLQAGVNFLELPRHEAYGTVAVFEDPFGNKWDLIQPAPAV